MHPENKNTIITSHHKSRCRLCDRPQNLRLLHDSPHATHVSNDHPTASTPYSYHTRALAIQRNPPSINTSLISGGRPPVHAHTTPLPTRRGTQNPRLLCSPTVPCLALRWPGLPRRNKSSPDLVIWPFLARRCLPVVRPRPLQPCYEALPRVCVRAPTALWVRRLHCARQGKASKAGQGKAGTAV